MNSRCPTKWQMRIRSARSTSRSQVLRLENGVRLDAYLTVAQPDSSTMAHLVYDMMHWLFSVFDNSRFKIFLTGAAAPYMIKTGKDLQVFYP